MKKKRNLYVIAFLCFITLVGVTIAYLQSTSTLENIFNAGTYQTVTHEEFISPTNWVPGDTTPKTITTTNEGTIPVRVRVKLEESWTSKNDEDLPLTYNNENVAIINFDNISDWIYKDGYYYYTDELGPNETTTSLIESVTFNPNISGDVDCTTVNGTVTCETTGDGYDGGTYKLKITTETVQAKNYEIIWEDVPIIYSYVGETPCTYNGELVPGAEYVNGQYTYRFRQEWNNTTWRDIDNNGWGVILTDRDSTDPVTSNLCSSINNKPITSMNFIFSGSKASSIDLSSFDTSNVTNMRGMFYVSLAQSLDVSNFDTSNVTDMKGMFYKNETTSLDLSSFDTSNVTDMGSMFEGSKAQSLDLSNFDTGNVNSMALMFSECEATTIDLSNFDTSNVTSMNYMFRDSKANSLDLRHFNTGNVTGMVGMFNRCEATTIDVSNFDTSKVTSMFGMFHSCKANTLDLSSFDTSNVTNTNNMFQNAITTTGYARTQADADKFNTSSNKPSTLTFVVKGS